MHDCINCDQALKQQLHNCYFHDVRIQLQQLRSKHCHIRRFYLQESRTYVREALGMSFSNVSHRKKVKFTVV